MTAIGNLTHGAPVDGLGLVFVLGSVPHERQPFNSCQSAAKDKGERRQNKPKRGGGKEIKRKRREEQRGMVNVVTKRNRE